MGGMASRVGRFCGNSGLMTNVILYIIEQLSLRVCLSVCLCMCQCLSVCLSVCPEDAVKPRNPAGKTLHKGVNKTWEGRSHCQQSKIFRT